MIYKVVIQNLEIHTFQFHFSYRWSYVFWQCPTIENPCENWHKYNTRQNEIELQRCPNKMQQRSFSILKVFNHKQRHQTIWNPPAEKSCYEIYDIHLGLSSYIIHNLCTRKNKNCLGNIQTLVSSKPLGRDSIVLYGCKAYGIMARFGWEKKVKSCSNRPNLYLYSYILEQWCVGILMHPFQTTLLVQIHLWEQDVTFFLHSFFD